MKPLLLTAIGRTFSSAPLGRRGDDVELRRIPALPTVAALDLSRPTVIALDRSLLASLGSDLSRVTELAGVAAIVGLGDAGEREPPPCFPTDCLTSWVPEDASVGVVLTALRGAFRHAVALMSARAAQRAADDRGRELAELSAIGAALSTERDLHTLLGLILTQACRVTCSDAGSIYLVEKDDDDKAVRLRFAMAHNHSLPGIPFSTFTMPIDHASLAGYAAETGSPLVIGDVYLLPDDATYRLNRSFDETFGYRTRSTLVLPLVSHRDEIVGVLQLINRKRHPDTRLTSIDVVAREVVTYDDQSVKLTSALASQAAVAIENGRLYEDIERLFEGFVTAAVTAIESRDPTTSGHSSRVAAMTVGLAETVDRVNVGPLRALTFNREQLRELRYAGLLHDFGKVGVREEVLVKEKKLYPQDLALIRHRFAFLLQKTELDFERERAEHLFAFGRDRYEDALAALDAARAAQRAELHRYFDVIVRANEPTVLPQAGSFDALHEIHARTFLDYDGVERSLLEDAELRFLMIRQGNLDQRERREIESHVTHTFRFLDQIPWTRGLRGIPTIAGAHHEKLNGAGYPNAVRGAAISVQARMMTIADIYDALTASDRPYKRAVSVERALEILSMEAHEGMLDRTLLDAFIGARVFELAALTNGTE